MPIGNEDRQFLGVFLGVMAVVVVIAVGSLILANIVTALSTPDQMMADRVAMIERRTEPYGVVNTSTEAVQQAQQRMTKNAQGGGGGGGKPMSGEEVYNSVCAACHSAGVMGAPVVGNQQQWTQRIAKGIETLHSHAINGFNAMPAKGGNPSLSDEEVKKSVDYMVAQSK